MATIMWHEAQPQNLMKKFSFASNDWWQNRDGSDRPERSPSLGSVTSSSSSTGSIGSGSVKSALKSNRSRKLKNRVSFNEEPQVKFFSTRTDEMSCGTAFPSPFDMDSDFGMHTADQDVFSTDAVKVGSDGPASMGSKEDNSSMKFDREDTFCKSCCDGEQVMRLFSTDEMRELCRNTTVHQFKCNHQLLKKGERGTSMFFLVSGKCEIRDRFGNSKIILPGAMLGEISFMAAIAQELSHSGDLYWEELWTFLRERGITEQSGRTMDIYSCEGGEVLELRKDAAKKIFQRARNENNVSEAHPVVKYLVRKIKSRCVKRM